jgi:hypothetical protein
VTGTVEATAGCCELIPGVLSLDRTSTLVFKPTWR